MSKTVLRMPVLFRYDRKNEPSLNRLWQWLTTDAEFRAHDCTEQLTQNPEHAVSESSYREKTMFLHAWYDPEVHEEMLDAVIHSFEHIGKYLGERKMLKSTPSAPSQTGAGTSMRNLEALVFYPDTNELQKPMTRMLRIVIQPGGDIAVRRIEYHKQLAGGRRGN